MAVLDNASIDAFRENIGADAAALLEKIGEMETWPADDDIDVEKAIDQLSTTFANEEAFLKLSDIDPGTLLGLTALLSLPRSMSLFKEMGDKDIELLRKISAEDAATTNDELIFQRTIFSRLSTVARTQIISRMFSAERCNLVFNALLGDD